MLKKYKKGAFDRICLFVFDRVRLCELCQFVLYCKCTISRWEFKDVNINAFDASVMTTGKLKFWDIFSLWVKPVHLNDLMRLLIYSNRLNQQQASVNWVLYFILNSQECDFYYRISSFDCTKGWRSICDGEILYWGERNASIEKHHHPYWARMLGSNSLETCNLSRIWQKYKSLVNGFGIFVSSKNYFVLRNYVVSIDFILDRLGFMWPYVIEGLGEATSLRRNWMEWIINSSILTSGSLVLNA